MNQVAEELIGYVFTPPQTRVDAPPFVIASKHFCHRALRSPTAGWPDAVVDADGPSSARASDGRFEGASVKMRKTNQRIERDRERGFSIIELLTVCIIAMTVMAMAIIQMQPMWQQFQANSGFDQVKTTLRQARELAISQRRTIVVQLLAPAGGTPCLPASNVFNCIALTQVTVVAGTPPTQVQAANPFLVIPIQNSVQLISFSGEPDTPDAFIGSPPTPPNGIYTGAAAGAPNSGIQFQSDGTLTNGNGNPINLTLFLGVANMSSTARSVTVLGNTGRVSPYRGTGKAWFR
jgi:Tfp pilus assembly protein FimT